MKKSVLISMLFLVGMAFSVAAGCRPPTVDNDVGQYYDSVKFLKSNDNQIISSANQAGLTLPVLLPAVELEQPTAPAIEAADYVTGAVNFKPPKGLIKERIHILNCSILQFS